ncbi:hypothetical protein GCM10028862_16680 [Luteimonas pelagia]
MKHLLLLLSMLTTGVAHAVEIKGLTLGQTYDVQSLANIFGNATCPPASEGVLGRARVFNSVRCHVPISYLGLKTSADVVLSRDWMVRSLQISIPAARITDVEEVLAAKYGEPSLRRGEFERMVPGLNGGAEQPLLARCSVWNEAQGAQVRVCEAPVVPIGPGGPYVEYSLSLSAPLDATDL